MSVQIKKGISIPNKHNTKLSEYYDAMGIMEIGDSFDVDPKDVTNIVALRATAYKISKRIKIKITTRIDVKGILTIWRVE